jgi:hypothetical protein
LIVDQLSLTDAVCQCTLLMPLYMLCSLPNRPIFGLGKKLG